MTQKVVLGVKTSAEARTPVYLSITGVAALLVTASRYPLTGAVIQDARLDSVGATHGQLVDGDPAIPRPDPRKRASRSRA